MNSALLILLPGVLPCFPPPPQVLCKLALVLKPREDAWPREHILCPLDWTLSLPFLLIIPLSSPVADRLVCQEDKCPLRSSDRDASSWEKSLQYPSRIQPDGSKQRQCLPPPSAFKDELAKGRVNVAEGTASRSRGQSPP